jgi:hypothetical protein
VIDGLGKRHEGDLWRLTVGKGPPWDTSDLPEDPPFWNARVAWWQWKRRLKVVLGR